MKAINKAIWYIENHYRDQVSLDALAEVAGVSRYHLSRMFCYAVGQPISRYIRLRRLSTTAIALAAGESDILFSTLLYQSAMGRMRLSVELSKTNFRRRQNMSGQKDIQMT